MGLQARAKVEPTWFTPEDQEGDPQPSRFKVRPLTAGEQAEVLATMQASGGRATAVTFRECFVRGVIEIENVTNSEGKAIRYAQQMITTDLLDTINDVGAHIFNISFLTEDERKNS